MNPGRSLAPASRFSSFLIAFRYWQTSATRERCHLEPLRVFSPKSLRAAVVCRRLAPFCLKGSTNGAIAAASRVSCFACCSLWFIRCGLAPPSLTPRVLAMASAALVRWEMNCLSCSASLPAEPVKEGCLSRDLPLTAICCVWHRHKPRHLHQCPGI